MENRRRRRESRERERSHTFIEIKHHFTVQQINRMEKQNVKIEFNVKRKLKKKENLKIDCWRRTEHEAKRRFIFFKHNQWHFGIQENIKHFSRFRPLTCKIYDIKYLVKGANIELYDVKIVDGMMQDGIKHLVKQVIFHVIVIFSIHSKVNQ